MNYKQFPVQLSWITLLLLVLSSIPACKKKDNLNTYYFSGYDTIEIRITADTLGILLKDPMPDSAESYYSALNKFKILIDTTLSQQGYASAGYLPEADNIKLIISNKKNKRISQFEKEAQDLKKSNKNLISNAGYLAYIKKSGEPIIITGELNIEFMPTTNDTQIHNLFAQHKLEIVRKNPFVPLHYTVSSTVESPNNAVKLTHTLKNNSIIKSANINFIYRKKIDATRPTDNLFERQWNLLNNGDATATNDADIDADLAWDFTQGTENTIIAIIDDGFDLFHNDLKNNFAINTNEIPWNNLDDDDFDNDPTTFIDDTIGWNFLNFPGSNYLEGGNHGTSVTGVAVADSNGIGVVGSCPKCSVIPLRTLSGADEAMDALAIDYAKSRGAKIINFSWHPRLDVPEIVNAIDRATSTGIIVICTVPNDDVNSCESFYISSLPNTIAISRSSRTDSYDNRGTGSCLDLLAPSTNNNAGDIPKITTTDIMGGFGYSDGSTDTWNCGDEVIASGNYTTCFWGTSAAAPLTAGVAGLLLSANSSLTRLQVQYLLQDCADKIEDSRGVYAKENGKSTTGTHGFGRLNAYEAVKIASARTDIGGRNGVDIFLRDNELDWGNTEKPSNYFFEPVRGFIPHWWSQDIKVDAPDASSNFRPPVDSRDFETIADEKPIANKKNMVYVRVHNRGFRTAARVNVKLYWVYAGMALPALWSNFPQDVIGDPTWHFLGNVTLNNLEYSGASVAYTAEDKSQIASFEFNAPMPDPAIRNHYCLTAIIDSPDDQLIVPMFAGISSLDEASPKFNNITHRNYSIVVEAETSGLITENLSLYNPYPFSTQTKISIINPKNIKIKINGLLVDSVFILKAKEQKPFTIVIEKRDLRYPTEITLQQELMIPTNKKKKIFGGFTFYFTQ